MKIQGLIYISIFYLLMAIFTVVSPMVYRSSLPEVTVSLPEVCQIEDDGKNVNKLLIPKHLMEQPIYVVELREKNGEIRSFAKLVTVSFDEIGKDGYAVVDMGLFMNSVIIVDGMEGVVDGQEVYIKNKHEIKIW